MIISILLALIFFVLMFTTKDLNSKIEYAALMIISEVAVWGNYILNALEKQEVIMLEITYKDGRIIIVDDYDNAELEDGMLIFYKNEYIVMVINLDCIETVVDIGDENGEEENA